MDNKNNINRNVIISILVAIVAFFVYVFKSIFSRQQNPDQAAQYENQK